MVLSTALLSIALLAPAEASPSPSPRPRTQMTFEELLPLGIVLEVEGMDRAVVKRDLVYKSVDGRPLRFDAYLPTGLATGSARPAVILAPGGVSVDTAPRPKDWGVYVSWGRLMAASGFIGITVDYRLSYPRRQYAEGAADLADLMAFLARPASGLPVDPERLAVVAFSGGGPMLAPLLAGDAGGVRCLAAFYTFMDTDHVSPAEAGASAEVLRRFSPLAVSEANPRPVPLFLAMAGRDEIAPVNPSIERFLGSAVQRRAPVSFFVHPEGAHGFDRKNNDDRTRYIIRALVQFLGEHLR